MPKPEAHVEPELTRVVEVLGLPQLGRDYTIASTPDERSRVAARLGLRELPALKAAMHLVPVQGGGIRISGTFEADVVQDCVVTLAPVRAHIDGEVSAVLVQGDDQEESEIDVDIEGADIEILRDGTADLGEILVEHLALAIDPYPRAPGATFTAPPGGGIERPEITPSPFAVLAKLKSTN
jgi:uncharacterized metal-binding protein YceD (DUF177 family)